MYKQEKGVLKVIMLALVITFATVLASYGEDSTALSAASETERLVDKYSAKVYDTVVTVADQLKEPAEHAYKVLVRKNFIHGVSFVSLTLILLVVGVWLMLKTDFRRIDEDIHFARFLVGGIIIAIAVVLSMFGLSTAINNIFNPEYAAMIEISKLLK